MYTVMFNKCMLHTKCCLATKGAVALRLAPQVTLLLKLRFHSPFLLLPCICAAGLLMLPFVVEVSLPRHPCAPVLDPPFGCMPQDACHSTCAPPFQMHATAPVCPPFGCMPQHQTCMHACTCMMDEHAPQTVHASQTVHAGFSEASPKRTAQQGVSAN